MRRGHLLVQGSELTNCIRFTYSGTIRHQATRVTQPRNHEGSPRSRQQSIIVHENGSKTSEGMKKTTEESTDEITLFQNCPWTQAEAMKNWHCVEMDSGSGDGAPSWRRSRPILVCICPLSFYYFLHASNGKIFDRRQQNGCRSWNKNDKSMLAFSCRWCSHL